MSRKKKRKNCNFQAQTSYKAGKLCVTQWCAEKGVASASQFNYNHTETDDSLNISNDTLDCLITQLNVTD